MREGVEQPPPPGATTRQVIILLATGTGRQGTLVSPFCYSERPDPTGTIDSSEWYDGDFQVSENQLLTWMRYVNAFYCWR
jgi:hypothetical protein